MNNQRSLLFALLISVVAHAIAVAGTGWRLPGDGDGAPPRLDATLALPMEDQPPPRPAKPRRTRGAATRAPSPATEVAPPEPVATEAAAEVGSPAGTASPVEEPTLVANADSPVAAAKTAGRRLPYAFKLHYRISLGDSGLVIGTAAQEFSRDERSYRMRSVLETTGIARLFKSIQMVYQSDGEVVDGGLRPVAFHIARDGLTTERARFDWAKMQAVVSPSERQVVLEAGAQDILSLFCQLSVLPVDGDRIIVPVVTRKRVERYEFVLVGKEDVDTGRGRLSAVHIHYQDADGPATTDVWLAPSVANLPVRIYMVDQKGDAYDQTADSIEFQEGEAH
jgi:hypothetical protein